MREMVIYGVSFDMVGKQPIVLLKTVDSNKFLPIWIGHPEAAAILMKLQGASTPRPRALLAEADPEVLLSPERARRRGRAFAAQEDHGLSQRDHVGVTHRGRAAGLQPEASHRGSAGAPQVLDAHDAVEA